MDEEQIKQIPFRTREALRRWVQRGILPGGFLQCVMSNDLFGAIRRADAENLKALALICQYLHHECPATCFGFDELVDSWPGIVHLDEEEE